MIVLEYRLTFRLLESEFKEAICSGVFFPIGDMPRDAPFRTKFFGQVVFLVCARLLWQSPVLVVSINSSTIFLALLSETDHPPSDRRNWDQGMRLLK